MISLVAGQENIGSGTAAATVAFANTPATGNLIIATSQQSTIVSSGAPTITDGSLNAFTLIESDDRTVTTNGVSLYAYIAGASQSTSVIATGSGAGTIYLNIYEFTGNYAATNGTATTFLDTNQRNKATGSSTGSATLTMVTSYTNSMVFQMVGLSSQPTTTFTSSGATILQTNPGPLARQTNLTDANNITTSPGSYGVSFSWNGAIVYGHLAAAFRSADGVIPSTSHFLTTLGAGT